MEFITTCPPLTRGSEQKSYNDYTPSRPAVKSISCDFLVFNEEKKGNAEVLYPGVTNNLHRRASEHKDNIVDGFTQKRGAHNLVYVEGYDDIRKAISREKQLKKWERERKVRLIEEFNPEWKDLYSELNGQDEFPPS